MITLHDIIDGLTSFLRKPVSVKQEEPVPMALHASGKIVDLIKRWEGYRGTAYKPVATEQYYTIGWGHYGADVTAGMTITAEEGTRLLLEDIYTKCEKPLDALCSKDGVVLNQQEYDALVSFVFNLGSGKLASSTLWKKVVAGDRQGAADEFGKWVKAGGKVLPGLVRRRACERNIWLNGVYAETAS